MSETDQAKDNLVVSSGEDAHDPRAEIYRGVVATLLSGMVRIREAAIVYLTTQIALMRLHMPPPVPIEALQSSHPEIAEVVKGLHDIRYDDFDSYCYISQASLLVYGTTLFDTFLSDTTQFLLVLFPGALDPDNTVSVSDLLKKPKHEVLNKAISDKVRSLSFGKFVDRIAFLNKRFGLGVQISDSDSSLLEEATSLRNSVVHDQGIFAVELDDSGKPRIRRKSCPRHPTPITNDEYKRATRIYNKLSFEVFVAVMERVLKTKVDREGWISDFCRCMLSEAEADPQGGSV